MRSTIIFDCYIRACEYKKGKEFGFLQLKRKVRNEITICCKDR